MIKKSKRAMTLIEMLIAMGLTMVLLSTLMFFYYQITLLNFQIDKKENQAFQKLFLSTRLSEILPKTVSPNDVKKDFYFFTSYMGEGDIKPGESSLVFTFDNGVKLDPHFSNHVLGRLYIDRSNRLSLAIWPSPARWEEYATPPMKKEILLENVESLQFSYYVPPEKDRKNFWNRADIKKKENKALQMDVEGSWRPEWHQEYGELPALIKIILTQVGSEGPERTELVFPLPNTNLAIIYDR